MKYLTCEDLHRVPDITLECCSSCHEDHDDGYDLCALRIGGSHIHKEYDGEVCCNAPDITEGQAAQAWQLKLVEEVTP